jgi:hypothetical protein
MAQRIVKAINHFISMERISGISLTMIKARNIAAPCTSFISKILSCLTLLLKKPIIFILSSSLLYTQFLRNYSEEIDAVGSGFPPPQAVGYLLMIFLVFLSEVNLYNFRSLTV